MYELEISYELQFFFTLQLKIFNFACGLILVFIFLQSSVGESEVCEREEV